jgi:hypothetical protein
MNDKAAAFKARMIERGLVQANEWIPSNQRALFKAVALALRQGVAVRVGDPEPVPSNPEPVAPPPSDPEPVPSNPVLPDRLVAFRLRKLLKKETWDPLAPKSEARLALEAWFKQFLAAESLLAGMKSRERSNLYSECFKVREALSAPKPPPSPEEAAKRRAAADKAKATRARKAAERPHVILGVAIGATQDEIKGAWKKAASKYHPDRGGDAELFKKARAAYEKLAGC